MALQGEIMKYVGNELMNVGSKGLAKAGGSALSSLIPKMATQATTNLATKAGTSLATGPALNALDALIPKTDDTIDLFRGQIKGNDNLYYNKGNGTGGSATVGNGFYMTPNKEKTTPWLGEGVEPVQLRAKKSDILTRDELVAKTNWANDVLGDLDTMKNLYENDPQQAELVEALATGHLPEVSKYLDKPFIQPDSGQGEELAETIFFPDTRPMLTSKYRQVLQQNAQPYVPAGIEANKNVAFGRLADTNGKPMSLYHSTPNQFDRFDDSMLGENTLASNTAYGHFTTPDKEFSSRFKDIDNKGIEGRTMELQAKLQNPITHPYGAADKYSGEELDRIVENYYRAIGAEDSLAELKQYAAEDGQSLYDEYMDMTIGEDPYEVARDEREYLMKNGYDGLEIVEGPRSGLIEGATENTPVSSIVAFEGKNLVPVKHLPINAVEGAGTDIPVNKAVMDKVAKYLKSPTDASGNPMMTKVMPEYTTIYHNTPLDNVDSIVKNGIKADAGARKYADKSEVGVWGSSVKGDGYGGSTIAFRMPADEAKKYMVNDTEYLIPRDIAPEDIVDVDRMLMSSGGATLRQSQIPEKIAKYGEDKVVEVMKRFGADDNTIKAMLGKNNKVSKYLQAPTDANADGVINWNDVKAVYNQAKQQQAELDKMGRAIAEKEGFPEYTDFSPKSIESMENKVKRKGGDYSLASMKDHTRNKIMMNSWEDVPKVISDMEQMGLSPDVEFVLNDWGYKGLHITGRFDNGLGWEIQLTTPEDWPRKLKSDAIYDKWRNTQLDTASPKEVMGYLNAMRESKAMWSESKIPDLSMYDNVTGR